ncbi:MAG: GNAT family N-acetyltransferase [Oscillospiraceae bacterium]|jgi:GNAT superfamily N-acetyltransferase|nr:GNAT family N-acetyltransferase [Oscillospiraceae bacterium]
MYLPNTELRDVPPLCDVRWFEESDLAPFYGDARFSNVLQPAPNPRRPDVLAVASYDGEAITGNAGASADTPEMWQIGVDVLPEYRGRGLGAYLVSLLKNEILRRGKLPYYGTTSGNLASRNVARAAGFFPAWLESFTEEPAVWPD